MIDALRIALHMLSIHKMRALLTMLGVIIGVFSVSMIVLALSAFQNYIKSEFSRIGSDTIFITYAPFQLEEGQSVGGVDGLYIADVNYIKERVPEIETLAGYREAGRHMIQSGDESIKNVPVKAIDENFVELNKIDLISGRWFTAVDQRNNASVAVISDGLRDEFFGKDVDPLGRILLINGLTVQVVGVSKDLDLMGERDTKVVFVPLSTASSKWLGGTNVDLIIARPKPGNKVADVMDKVWQSMMAKSGNRKVYNVESSENVLKIFTGILGGIGTVFSAIAALSLLVGGIGVMNIMLVSVTERTREIGLRKAVGAKRAQIMKQFLIESSILTLVGGIIGMLFAWGLGMIMTVVTVAQKWPSEGGLVAPFPVGSAVGAILFSAFIGLVFGFYPAYRASTLNPIEALRTE